MFFCVDGEGEEQRRDSERSVLYMGMDMRDI